MVEKILRKTNPDVRIEKRVVSSKTPDVQLESSNNYLDENDIKLINEFKGIRYSDQKTRDSMERALKKLNNYIANNNKLPNNLNYDNLVRILTEVHKDPRLLDLIKSLK